MTCTIYKEIDRHNLKTTKRMNLKFYIVVLLIFQMHDEKGFFKNYIFKDRNFLERIHTFLTFWLFGKSFISFNFFILIITGLVFM
jgi:hypothetical protein